MRKSSSKKRSRAYFRRPMRIGNSCWWTMAPPTRVRKLPCNMKRKYPAKVRYLDHSGHKNRGMSASRNLGLYHAKGDYIALLDSDDVWLSHKLEQQVTIPE